METTIIVSFFFATIPMQGQNNLNVSLSFAGGHAPLYSAIKTSHSLKAWAWRVESGAATFEVVVQVDDEPLLGCC